MLKFLTVVKKNKPISAWHYNRRTKKYPPNVLDAAIQSLEAQERLKVEAIIKNRKSGKYYSLI